MIEPNTSQPTSASQGDRSRLSAKPRAQTSSREFARVLQKQAQGAESAVEASGAMSFSEAGLLQQSTPLQSHHVTSTVRSADLLDGQEDGSTVNADEPASEIADATVSRSNAARAGNDASRAEGRVAQRPIVAKQHADSAAPPLASTMRANAKPVGAQQQPRARGGVRLLTRTATASLPLHVAVAAVEHGLAVRIATNALEEAEQRDLTDRIAELLARHGYAGATVSVNGVTTLLPSHEGQDTWR